MDWMTWVIGLAAYTAWAFYSGRKMLDGRYAWLEERQALKIPAFLLVGYALGSFYLVLCVVKLAFRITDGFK